MSSEQSPADAQAWLSGSAWAFAAATAVGSVVAIRDSLPGEPLGITVPLSVPRAIAVGWGAGIAPPWFMPVTAVVAARGARSGRPRPALVAGVIGVTCIAGHLVEPVTRRPGTWTAATAISMCLTVTSALSLAAAGFARYRANAAADESGSSPHSDSGGPS